MQRALSPAGRRLRFGRDPVTFQYYAGRGLQIQPLATFGHTNALASSCLRRTVRFGCRPRALRRLLDRMLALGSVRGGLLGWEYLFDFGSGAPPWISAMTQATGAQALARGRRVLGEGRYGVAARRALGAFEQPPPTGVAVADGRGRRYAMYSFAPRPADPPRRRAGASRAVSATRRGCTSTRCAACAPGARPRSSSRSRRSRGSACACGAGGALSYAATCGSRAAATGCAGCRRCAGATACGSSRGGRPGPARSCGGRFGRGRRHTQTAHRGGPFDCE